MPPFPVNETVGALADDPPHWPASTTDLRRAGCRLRFSPAGILANLIGQVADGTAELTLEILDYPGRMAARSALVAPELWRLVARDPRLGAAGARAPLARDWLDYLARHPADRAADHEVARAGA